MLPLASRNCPHKAEQHFLQTALPVEMLNELVKDTFSKLDTQSSSEVSTEKDIPKFMEMSEFAGRSVCYDQTIIKSINFHFILQERWTNNFCHR